MDKISRTLPPPPPPSRESDKKPHADPDTTQQFHNLLKKRPLQKKTQTTSPAKKTVTPKSHKKEIGKFGELQPHQKIYQKTHQESHQESQHESHQDSHQESQQKFSQPPTKKLYKEEFSQKKEPQNLTVENFQNLPPQMPAVAPTDTPKAAAPDIKNMASYLDKVCQRILLPSTTQGTDQNHMRFELSQRLLPGVALVVQKQSHGGLTFQFEAQVGASHAFLLAHKEKMARHITARTRKPVRIFIKGAK